MVIYESGENYLETILIITQKKGHVRSVDIANELGFSKPSVSRAVGKLKKGGYITVEKSGNIILTEEGENFAKAIYERHKLLTEFLVLTLGIDEALAAEDACKIEHVIHAETFTKVKKYIAENK